MRSPQAHLGSAAERGKVDPVRTDGESNLERCGLIVPRKVHPRPTPAAGKPDVGAENPNALWTVDYKGGVANQRPEALRTADGPRPAQPLRPGGARLSLAAVRGRPPALRDVADLPAAVPWTGRAGGIQGAETSGALPPLSAQRLLQRGDIVLPVRLGESSAQAGWGDRGACGRQAKVVEDGLHRTGLREVGEHHAAAAAGAGENVLSEHPHRQFSPRDTRWIRGGRVSAVDQSGAGVSVTAGAGPSGIAGVEAEEGAHANGVSPGGGGMT